MKVLIEFFGLDPGQFNEVGLSLATKDLSYAWILTLFVVPPALWFFWVSLKRIHSPFRKTLLISLRALTFFLLVFILLQPELEFKKSHILKNRIAVLVDDTKSMSIKTFPSEQSRADFVRQAFETNQGVLESLANIFQLDYYLISDQIEPTSSLSSGGRYSPKKTNTDFETVFSKLKTRYDGKSLQGVMLFSDGADLATQPETISSGLLTLLASWEGPIHSFQAGTNHMFKDLAIEEIDSADFGFVHQPVRGPSGGHSLDRGGTSAQHRPGRLGREGRRPTRILGVVHTDDSVQRFPQHGHPHWISRSAATHGCNCRHRGGGHRRLFDGWLGGPGRPGRCPNLDHGHPDDCRLPPLRHPRLGRRPVGPPGESRPDSATWHF